MVVLWCNGHSLREKVITGYFVSPFLAWDQEKSSSGKKFESPKKSNFFPVELFSSKNFLVHMEPDVLQSRDGRPLILKLIPNNEDWNNEIAWYS